MWSPSPEGWALGSARGDTLLHAVLGQAGHRHGQGQAGPAVGKQPPGPTRTARAGASQSGRREILPCSLETPQD